MVDIFKYFLFPTLMSVLLCIPSILFDTWLCKIGVSRKSNKLIIIIGTFFFAFLKQPVYEDVSWWIYGIIILVATLLVHRSDFGETMKYGKWWWKHEPEKGKKMRSNLR